MHDRWSASRNKIISNACDTKVAYVKCRVIIYAVCFVFSFENYEFQKNITNVMSPYVTTSPYRIYINNVLIYPLRGADFL